MGEYGREPCPYRILDDVGSAFAMGAIGGSIFHSVRGARNSPKGERLLGSLAAVKARGPVLGGNFAVWGGLFSSFDCTLTAIRRKEDPWNAIMSGAMTGGVLAARAGVKAAGKNALVGGVLLALIEGLGIMITRMTAPSAIPGAESDLLAPPMDTLAPPVAAGGGLMQGDHAAILDDNSSHPGQDMHTDASTGFISDSGLLHDEDVGHRGGDYSQPGQPEKRKKRYFF